MGSLQLTDYSENLFIDHQYRTRTWAKPTHNYVALFRVTSQSPRSTAVVSGTNSTIPVTPNGHVYRCTTSGTTGSGEPTWPTTSGGTVTDGTAVWTEMTPDFEGNTASALALELTGVGSYARVDLAPLDANWAATQGGNSGNSSGSGGTTSNSSAITFPAPTANWGLIVAYGLYDALTVGNLTLWDTLTTPRTVLNGDPAPAFAIGQIAITVG